MGRSVLFIHSAGSQGEGKGSSGLIAYLKKTLEGYDLRIPSMPDPENPRYEEWKGILKEEIAGMPEGAILIGHSIGGSALLKFLLEEEVGNQVKALISIAAPFWGMDDEWLKKDFTIADSVFSKDKHLPHILLYHCSHDAIVPFSHAQHYAKQLPDVALKALKGEDHLFLSGLAQLKEEIRRL